MNAVYDNIIQIFFKVERLVEKLFSSDQYFLLQIKHSFFDLVSRNIFNHVQFVTEVLTVLPAHGPQVCEL